MIFVYTAKGVLCVEHANVLELCYIELLSGDGSPYSILSGYHSTILIFFKKYIYQFVTNSFFIYFIFEPPDWKPIEEE